MSQFSRRTIVAAIDVLNFKLKQAETSRFLLKAGREIHDAVSVEGIAVRKRMNDLIKFVDDHPGYVTDDGSLETVIIRKAVTLLPSDHEDIWWPEEDKFRRVLQQDGFDVANGCLISALPKDIKLPSVKSELMLLLERLEFSEAKGHLEQALDNHARGYWASANSQLRTFFEALLDKMAEDLDSSVHAVGSGQPSREKLAKLNFLSIQLNEWDDRGKGFINGLIKRLHPAGAHPGLSDEDDSTFRLHIVLITARLLLRRYDRWVAREFD